MKSIKNCAKYENDLILNGTNPAGTDVRTTLYGR